MPNIITTILAVRQDKRENLEKARLPEKEITGSVPKTGDTSSVLVPEDVNIPSD